MQSVDVLGRVDGQEGLLLVQPGGERQLHQEGADRRVGVEAGDDVEHLGLGGAGRQVLAHRVHADAGTVLVLQRHVALAGHVVAHQHGPEAGAEALAAQSLHPVGHLGPDPGGHRFAVEQDGAHQCRKCRSPVMTIARPAPSAAAITSASFTEPPGWTTAVTPASANTSEAVGEGEEGVAGAGAALGRSPAFWTAISAATTRDC